MLDGRIKLDNVTIHYLILQYPWRWSLFLQKHCISLLTFLFGFFFSFIVKLFFASTRLLDFNTSVERMKGGLLVNLVRL